MLCSDVREIAAIEPDVVDEIRRTERRIAAAVGAVTGDAQGLEVHLAGGDPVGGRLVPLRLST